MEPEGGYNLSDMWPVPLGFWEMHMGGGSKNPHGRVDGGRWDKETSWPGFWGLEKTGGQDLGIRLTHSPWSFTAKTGCVPLH